MLDKYKDIKIEDIVCFGSFMFRWGFWAAMMACKYCDMDLNKIE